MKKFNTLCIWTTVLLGLVLVVFTLLPIQVGGLSTSAASGGSSSNTATPTVQQAQSVTIYQYYYPSSPYYTQPNSGTVTQPQQTAAPYTVYYPTYQPTSYQNSPYYLRTISQNLFNTPTERSAYPASSSDPCHSSAYAEEYEVYYSCNQFGVYPAPYYMYPYGQYYPGYYDDSSYDSNNALSNNTDEFIDGIGGFIARSRQ